MFFPRLYSMQFMDVILSLHFLFSQFLQPRHASFSHYHCYLTLTLSSQNLGADFWDKFQDIWKRWWFNSGLKVSKM